MKPTHGDKRKTSGRKPVADKNVQVSFYIEQSKIEKLGGLDTLKEKIIEYVERSCCSLKWLITVAIWQVADYGAKAGQTVIMPMRK